MAFIISGKFIALFILRVTPHSCHRTEDHLGTHAYPRLSAHRRAAELKFALEAFWRGELIETELRKSDARCGSNTPSCSSMPAWISSARVSSATTTPFSTTGALRRGSGALRLRPRKLPLTQYFELARGNAALPALEMTKWFDTNYHYLVPELGPDTRFDGGVDWFFERRARGAAARHAREAGADRPDHVSVARERASISGFDRLELLPALLPVYQRVLSRLQ